MPFYRFNIQLFEDGVRHVADDTIEADNADEAKRLAEEDYAGATITNVKEVAGHDDNCRF